MAAAAAGGSDGGGPGRGGGGGDKRKRNSPPDNSSAKGRRMLADRVEYYLRWEDDILRGPHSEVRSLVMARRAKRAEAEQRASRGEPVANTAGWLLEKHAMQWGIHHDRQYPELLQRGRAIAQDKFDRKQKEREEQAAEIAASLVDRPSFIPSTINATQAQAIADTGLIFSFEQPLARQGGANPLLHPREVSISDPRVFGTEFLSRSLSADISRVPLRARVGDTSRFEELDIGSAPLTRGTEIERKTGLWRNEPGVTTDNQRALDRAVNDEMDRMDQQRFRSMDAHSHGHFVTLGPEANAHHRQTMGHRLEIDTPTPHEVHPNELQRTNRDRERRDRALPALLMSQQLARSMRGANPRATAEELHKDRDVARFRGAALSEPHLALDPSAKPVPVTSTVDNLNSHNAHRTYLQRRQRMETLNALLEQADFQQYDAHREHASTQAARHRAQHQAASAALAQMRMPSGAVRGRVTGSGAAAAAIHIPPVIDNRERADGIYQRAHRNYYQYADELQRQRRLPAPVDEAEWREADFKGRERHRREFELARINEYMARWGYPARAALANDTSDSNATDLSGALDEEEEMEWIRAMDEQDRRARMGDNGGGGGGAGSGDGRPSAQ